MSPFEIADGLDDELDAQGRALFADDYALGMIGDLLRRSQSAIPDLVALTVLPVLLVEPVRSVLGAAGRAGAYEYDYRLAAARALGMKIVNESPMLDAPAWSVVATKTHVELVDPTLTVIARVPMSLEDEWRQCAKAAKRVSVLYGTALGVRLPQGHTRETYTEDLRRSEILGSLHNRAIAWAAIPFSDWQDGEAADPD